VCDASVVAGKEIAEPSAVPESTAGESTLIDFPAILERERTLVAEGVTAIKKAISCREWLTEGRGSYEWNDDRWHGEFAAAISEILEALKPLEKVAADLTNCPQDAEAVRKARAGAHPQPANFATIVSGLAAALNTDQDSIKAALLKMANDGDISMEWMFGAHPSLGEAAQPKREVAKPFVGELAFSIDRNSETEWSVDIWLRVSPTKQVILGWLPCDSAAEAVKECARLQGLYRGVLADAPQPEGKA
jgi:hypothetical protein